MGDFESDRYMAWWLAGGINPANCIAVYQPKGAASYAASLTDLTGNGHTLTEGTAPDWATEIGWTFDASNLEYLITDIPVAEQMTIAVSVKNADGTGEATAIGAGYYAGAHYNYTIIQPRVVNVSQGYFHKADYKTVFFTNEVADSISILSGYDCYYNNVFKGTISGGTWYPAQPMRDLHIGRLNRNISVGYFNGDILAVAIYSANITSGQASALYSVMNAL